MTDAKKRAVKTPSGVVPLDMPSRPPAVAEPLTTAHEAVLPLMTLLREAGVPCDEVEHATGLTLDDLKDPHLRIRLSACAWLWQRAAEATDDPRIGLNLIARYPENHMHFVAHLAMRCRTLGEAILQWRDYAPLVCDADEIGLGLNGSTASLRYRLLDPRFESRFFADHYLSMGVWYGRKFVGKHIEGKLVTLRHADPGYRDAYEELFGCPVRFEAPENEIQFDASFTHMQQVTADPYLQNFLQERAEAMSGAGPELSAVRQVTRNVTRAIAKGETLSLSIIASELAMSERSLSRALRTEGVSFRELVDVVRRDVAASSILRGLSVAQVTYLLGFSEAAALHHAFSRWYGVSIGEFRRQEGAVTPLTDRDDEGREGVARAAVAAEAP